MTTGEVVVKHLDGVEQILVLYPYVVEGGFTVVSKSPDGFYDAHFGMILQQNPHVCNEGYNAKPRNPETERGNAPMDMDARCTEPAAQSNARGAQHAPQRAGAAYRSPVVATYDPATERLQWGSKAPGGFSTPGTLAPRTLGEESWKWLFLQPLMKTQE